MVESNISISGKENPQKPHKSPQSKRKRPKNSSSLADVVFPVGMILFSVGLLFLLYTINQNEVTSQSEEIQLPVVEPPKETIIIEFEPQIIPVKCHGFKYKNYERVSWDESIKITPRGEFEYINNNNRLIILPSFSAYYYDNETRFDIDDIMCYTYGPFVFNLTVSGKTIIDNVRVNPEDCNEIMHCGIREELIRRVS